MSSRATAQRRPPPWPATPSRRRLAARTHAAWNTEAALGRTGTVRPLLVLGDGFGLTLPGAPFDVAVVAGDYADTTYQQPGYHVLGTIAATFGGDTTEAGLATGMLPGTTKVREVDIQDNNPTAGERIDGGTAVPGFNTTTNAVSNQAVCVNLPGPFLPPTACRAARTAIRASFTAPH